MPEELLPCFGASVLTELVFTLPMRWRNFTDINFMIADTLLNGKCGYHQRLYPLVYRDAFY